MHNLFRRFSIVQLAKAEAVTNQIDKVLHREILVQINKPGNP